VTGSAAFDPIWNLVILAVVLFMCIEVPRRRSEHRFGAYELVGVVGPDLRAAARAKDLSLHGARVMMPPNMQAQAGQSIHVRIRGVGRIPASVIDQSGNFPRVLFGWRDEAMRERMIVKLFASGAHEVGLRQASLAQILAATWRRAFGTTWLDAHNLRRGAAAQNADMGTGDAPSTPPKISHGGSAGAPPQRAAAGR
jgi:PilZ domain